MKVDEQIQLSLAYFTNPQHCASFEFLPGKGCVLVSAPHAVLQTRKGAIKCAERFTGMLCQLLHQRRNCPVLYKTRHLQDDANHDPQSTYRDELCRRVQEAGIGYVLDLHQLAPDRPMDLCLCTGKGHHLVGRQDFLCTIREAFQRQGLKRITLDDPFDAASPYTVSSTVVRECGIPAVQLEINSRLLMQECAEYCFPRILDALDEILLALNAKEGENPHA